MHHNKDRLLGTPHHEYHENVVVQVEEGFAKFDKSGDDKLDYEEFCMMVHKRQEEAKADQ